jgi:hypothetical protein
MSTEKRKDRNLSLKTNWQKHKKQIRIVVLKKPICWFKFGMYLYISSVIWYELYLTQRGYITFLFMFCYYIIIIHNNEFHYDIFISAYNVLWSYVPTVSLSYPPLLSPWV